MNNRSKIILVIVLILIGVVMTYFWVNVRGKEIDGVPEISPDCSVTIKVGITGEKEYILNGEQINMLRTLILESNFTRNFSTFVTYPAETEQYVIHIDWNNEQGVLHIYSAGNKYISIPDRFNGKHLKINNPQWETVLKKIISLSE